MGRKCEERWCKVQMNYTMQAAGFTLLRLSGEEDDHPQKEQHWQVWTNDTDQIVFEGFLPAIA